jgi:hypothetical protein
MNTVVDRQRESCCLHCHFHLYTFLCVMGYLVRFLGKWIEISPRPFEPERMTTDVAWIQITQGVDAPTAYRIWFAQQRKLSRLLQQ